MRHRNGSRSDLRPGKRKTQCRAWVLVRLHILSVRSDQNQTSRCLSPTHARSLAQTSRPQRRGRVGSQVGPSGEVSARQICARLARSKILNSKFGIRNSGNAQHRIPTFTSSGQFIPNSSAFQANSFLILHSKFLILPGRSIPHSTFLIPNWATQNSPVTQHFSFSGSGLFIPHSSFHISHSEFVSAPQFLIPHFKFHIPSTSSNSEPRTQHFLAPHPTCLRPRGIARLSIPLLRSDCVACPVQLPSDWVSRAWQCALV